MQLFYHPAFDSYHCIYRTLLLSAKTASKVIEVERMRIWDFYLVFPPETRQISFPSELSILKRSDIRPNTYENVVDPQFIFARMKAFQLTAYRSLAAFGLIESSELLNNRIVRTNKTVPSTLLSRFDATNEGERYVLSLVASALNNLPLYGPKGLKQRTKLLDYKYDVA